MSRKVVMIHCHPRDDSLIAAARDRALVGVAQTSAELRLHDLYAENFSPELTADEHRGHAVPGVVDELQSYADDLRWADTIIFVYPTWWSGQPAMLKGWIDRVFACGVAWELPEGANRLRPTLRNVKRIVAVTTHGSSKLINSAQGEGGKRTLFRSIRTMCHPLVRCHWIALYGVDAGTATDRARFLDRVERSVARITR